MRSDIYNTWVELWDYLTDLYSADYFEIEQLIDPIYRLLMDLNQDEEADMIRQVRMPKDILQYLSRKPVIYPDSMNTYGNINREMASRYRIFTLKQNKIIRHIVASIALKRRQLGFLD